MLAGEPGAYADVSLLNAAAALVVAGRADDIAAGLDIARASLKEGKASEALERLVAVSNAA